MNKNCDFRLLSRFISKTVYDMVTVRPTVNLHFKSRQVN